MAESGDSARGSEFRLNDIWPILWMNLNIIVVFTVAAAVTTAFATLLMTKQYKATAVLQVMPTMGQEVQVEEVLEMDVRGGFQEVERYYRTQLEIMRTRTVAEEVVRRYAKLGFEDLDEDNGPAAVLGMLTVFPRERSQLIEISITDDDPQRAALLANLVAKVYVDQNLEARREAAREAQRWLDAKITEYETQVLDSSAAMLEYKAEHDVIDIEETVTSLSARMVALDRSYGEKSTDRVLLSTEIRAHEALLAKGQYGELAAVLDTDLLGTLAKLETEARAELSTIASRYGQKHDEYRRAELTLERVTAELKSETKKAVDAEKARLETLTAQEEELLAEIDATKADLLERQRLQTDYATLKLEYERAESFLKRLRKRSDELDLSSRTQLNNARIIQTAIPPKRHVKPRFLLNLGLGTLAGLAGGISLAFLRYYLDDTISTATDLATTVQLPLLGVIPHVDAKPGETPDLHTVRNPNSIVAESARSLRTILEFKPGGQRLRRLIITSSIAGEGKTATCVRIGAAFAQYGRRVCIVETDHRRARVHKVFGFDNSVGVTSVLAGGMLLDDVIQPTAVPNLSAIPLGPSVEDGYRLLTSNLMEALLEQLDERFDLVIIDTPPAGLLTEAVQLSRLVDGVLLVVRTGAVSRSIVRHTVDRLHHVGANVLGVVLNQVDPPKLWAALGGRAGRGYGYYGYYPYYGKSYEQDPEDSEEREAAGR